MKTLDPKKTRKPRPDVVKRNKSKKQREAVSRSWRRVVKTNVRKQKISEALKGIKQPTGEQARNWKGNQVGYYGLHKWIVKEYGQPEKCELCGKNGLKKHQIHWANRTGRYLRERKDWLRLCASCHKTYDHKNKVRAKY